MAGQLVKNMMHFARTLRAVGIPAGPGATLDAIESVRAIGLRRRDDFYWALASVFVKRRDQQELFDQAFHVFWRNPKILERMMSMLLPSMQAPSHDEDDPLSRRLSDALLEGRDDHADSLEPEEEQELQATLTWSKDEVLRGMDFEQMSQAEIERAKALIARMKLPLPKLLTRRFQPTPLGRQIDLRNTLRKSLRAGSGDITLAKRNRRRRPASLVLICDISGSMHAYSRMLLHFAHTLGRQRHRVHTFVFGTRLTNITRHLRQKDVDLALNHVASDVEDWSGGTRIGHCLKAFNVEWLRRTCGQGAVVLLISDGLDRDAGEDLATQVERLQQSSKRLIWLNPLLRYNKFEPRAAGIRAILPHVDVFQSIHNLESLDQLCHALSAID